LDDARAGNLDDDRARWRERFWLPIRADVLHAKVLAEAAQRFADHVYADASTSAALVRVFVTVPYAWLPAEERVFINEFVEKVQATQTLDDETPVLVLLGTHGIESNWNDRTKSSGHRAIPLLSEAFVAEAPMIARLLRETGFSLPSQIKANRQFVRDVGAGNLFFVGDATNTTDERGRRIIPATDFVDRYGIRTVYGSGAAYSNGLFLTGIVFSRKVISRDDAARIPPLMRELVDATSALATPATMFPPPV